MYSVCSRDLSTSIVLKLIRAIDKVYRDGPCELLIRRSIDKLLAEYFCNQEIPGPIVLQTFELGNSKAHALFLLVLMNKVSNVTHSFETRKQNTGLCFIATRSMIRDFFLNNLSM